MAETFADLNDAYIAARRAWVAHVEHCGRCERSPFACESGGELKRSMESRLSDAGYCWGRMGWKERDQIAKTTTPPAAPGPEDDRDA